MQANVNLHVAMVSRVWYRRMIRDQYTPSLITTMTVFANNFTCQLYKLGCYIHEFAVKPLNFVSDEYSRN